MFGRREASAAGAVCVRALFDPFPFVLFAEVILSDAPNPLPQRWREKGHDAVRLGVQLTDCRKVQASGPLPGQPCPVEFTWLEEQFQLRLHDGGFEMLVVSDFAAMTVRSVQRGVPS